MATQRKLFISPYDIVNGETSRDDNLGVYSSVYIDPNGTSSATLQIPIVKSLTVNTGSKITSINVAYKIDQGGLTAASTNLSTYTYIDQTSPTITNIGTTDSNYGLTATNFYVGTTTVTSPFFSTGTDLDIVNLTLTFSADSTANAIVKILGVEVFYDFI